MMTLGPGGLQAGGQTRMLRHGTAGVDMTAVHPQLITTRALGASLRVLTTAGQYTKIGHPKAQGTWNGLKVDGPTAMETADMLIGGERAGGRKVRPVNSRVTLGGTLAVVIEQNGNLCTTTLAQKREDMERRRIELGSQRLLGNRHPATITKVSGTLMARNHHNRNPSVTTKNNAESGVQTMAT